MSQTFYARAASGGKTQGTHAAPGDGPPRSWDHGPPASRRGRGVFGFAGLYNGTTKPNTWSRHRRALESKLSDGLILLAGGLPVARNHDVDYVFRQDSDFLYLTGIEEAGCLLLMDPKRRRHTLFIPRIDNHHRVWLGPVPGPAEARRLWGIDRVLYADQLPGELKAAHRGYRKLYALRASLRRLARSRARVDGLSPRSAALRDALDELRAVKTAGEIARMRRAGEVSGRAHRLVMRIASPGMFEYEVQAIFEAACRSEGFRHLGYPSIVAAGRNAAVLHYMRNDARLRPGELLLIDAGAENQGYAADITRTFPAGGRFSRRQRDIYEIVLAAQKAMIAISRPPILSSELHARSMAMIAQGLKSLGVLKGDVPGLVQGGAVRLFYPHGLTHMLGLDVHDVTGGRRRRAPNPTKVPVRFVARLEPGFVITMEPGIYFISALLRDPELRRKHRGSVDFAKAESYLGVGGVRIEDDIVVRKDGPPLNLTDVPKEVADVEAEIAAGSRGARR